MEILDIIQAGTQFIELMAPVYPGSIITEIACIWANLMGFGGGSCGG